MSILHLRSALLIFLGLNGSRHPYITGGTSMIMLVGFLGFAPMARVEVFVGLLLRCYTAMDLGIVIIFLKLAMMGS